MPPAPEEAAKPAANREVTVYSWGEYIDESLIDEFEAQTGITVNYRTVPSNEELYSQLQQGAHFSRCHCPFRLYDLPAH